MTPGLFITGTGTGVGKTYVAALIARALKSAGLRVGVYKPVASGCDTIDGQLVSPDAVALWEAAGQWLSLEQVAPQLFSAPLAPHLAARAEGKRIDAVQLRAGIEAWRAASDVVVVEGAGGLMSPVGEDEYNADLAADFGYPLIVVTENVLGTINATLQTLVTAIVFSRDSGDETSTPGGLDVAGIVLNAAHKLTDDPSVDSNADELARRCVAPLLAIVEHGGQFDRHVDWRSLCGA